ncbi:peptidylprolyl isomerase [Falsirhodobacter sp. alg1]|uniref:peptidylprolyl isomerase n=1 Tax=Falsirhodobacter sp. alg1 TaxID=1472418 RepID=UPI0005EE5B6B|nr:peptidylprolyl isomerase [Falsirhodobacter sp. alg1]
MNRLHTILLATAIALAPIASGAQSLFAPHVIVNGDAVTNWELSQRQQFLTLLRAPGDLAQQAEDGLIEDRLKLSAAKQAGITVSDEAIQNGMVEFARRANLGVDEFIAQIEAAGVDRTTFRDFVRAGLLWRSVVRDTFSSRVVISQADVDRAIEAQGRASNYRILLSELILPAPPGQESQTLEAAREIAGRVANGDDFAEFARRYSATPSAANGGALEWLPLSDLPAGLQPIFMALKPGGVTEPLPIPNAVALFQLRALEETAPTVRPTEVELAFYPLPAGSDPAAKRIAITSDADTCTDLYRVAREDGVAVQRQTLQTAALPANMSQTVSGLDQNETAIITQNGTPTLVMLCARRPVSDTPVDRSAIENQLTNQQLTSMAEVYLSQLRDNAIIRTP